MSKALIIKNADFSANKITTVTFDDGAVHCSSITLDNTTVSLSSLTDTAQLTATVLPATCTQDVIWTSSNTNVATVANGLVSCVGVGAATITAKCGSKTATCSVSSSISISFGDMDSLQGKSINSNHDYASATTDSVRSDIYFSATNVLSGYHALQNFNNETYASWAGNVYPYPLPKGTKRISYTTNQSRRMGLYLFDSQKPNAYLNNDGAMMLQYQFESDYATTRNYTLPDGISPDGFILALQTSGATATPVSGTITFHAE